MMLTPVPFASSDIVNLGYDPSTMEMQVQFKNGSVYRYEHVETDTYNSLLAGGGEYFHTVIKPQRLRYVYTRLV